MTESIIIAAARSLDQQGDLAPVHQLIDQAQTAGLNCVTLSIDDLNTPWQSPLKPYHFRSGCAPLEALAVANRMIQHAEADVVILHGRDYLRTEYTPGQRHEKMAIYPEMSIPEAYTLLARHFCQRQGFSEAEFTQLRDAVFDNLRQTALKNQLKQPTDNWYQPLTELFRGVDCANPVIDFEGLLVVTGQDSPLPHLINPVAIKGVGIGIADNDGPGAARELARYHALEKACHYAEVQSGVDLAAEIRAPETLLEAYTCYPVVPLALLIHAASLQTPKQLLALLQSKALTCTGGMNLARGPWNNAALNGLITMCQALQQTPTLGIVQGNGGLGYRQGIAVLSGR